jgi:type II restriction enzyme
MILDMGQSAGSGYKSGCQITRRISEQWGADNLFCAACSSDVVSRAAANTKAIDFRCPGCDAGYQLKAGRHWNERRIPDAGFAAMMAAVQSDRVPNLLVLQYSRGWRVENLMLVPSFLFNSSAIQRRKPLGLAARRAWWIGCNILLSAMPELGKIRIVDGGSIVDRGTVRDQYERLRPLAYLAPKVLGWTLDVLRVVQALDQQEFTLADVYAYEDRLQVLHPDNQNVRPKIRQQLQVLRDLGMLEFFGRGNYRLVV